MAEQTGGEDLEWLSDCIVGILKSPTWVSPIASFVDERCIIFDDEEENKLEYTTCHNDFRMLVDDLLTAHLLELSLSYEQFEHFCEHGLSKNPRLHRILVEQLVGVEDFLVFKAMMVKRNIDLFREALAQIENNGGEVSEDPPLQNCRAAAAMVIDDAVANAAATCVAQAGRRGVDNAMRTTGGSDTGSPRDVGEDGAVDGWHLYEDEYGSAAQYEREQLEAAIRASEDLDEQIAQTAAEEADIAHAIALSLQAEEERSRICAAAAAASAAEATGADPVAAAEASVAATAPPAVAEGAPAAAAPMAAAPATPGARSLPPLVAAPGAPLRPALPRLVRVPPVGRAPPPAEPAEAPPAQPARPAITAAEAAAMATASAAATAVGAGRGQPSDAEVRQRAEHLRRQRDILVQKRNQERERQMGEFKAAKLRRAADGAAGALGGAAEPSGRQLAAELAGAPVANPLPDDVKAQAAAHMRQALAAQLKQSFTGNGGGPGPQ